MRNRKIKCNLKQIRMNRGLSQTEVAKRCGVGRRLISILENNKDNITLTSIERILNGLNISIEELFTDD